MSAGLMMLVACVWAGIALIVDREPNGWIAAGGGVFLYAQAFPSRGPQD
jgi:hypothetical protein